MVGTRTELLIFFSNLLVKIGVKQHPIKTYVFYLIENTLFRISVYK